MKRKKKDLWTRVKELTPTKPARGRYDDARYAPALPSKYVPASLALAEPRQMVRFSGGQVLPFQIYALVNKSDGCVRYVGQTRMKLERRLDWHMTHPTNKGVAEWLRSSGRPRIVLLERVSRKDWEAAERGWIYWFRQRGELLNVDMGGICRKKTGAPLKVHLGDFQPPKSSHPIRKLNLSW